MKFLNKVQLRGVVGNVHTTSVSTRFSLATEHAYKEDGYPVIETTWFNCISVEPKAVELKKGDRVELLGRIRIQSYINVNGVGRESIEVLVNSFHRLLSPAETIAMNASKEQNGHIVK